MSSLLVLAGDVELDLGPPNCKYPCRICSKPVKKSDSAVCCDQCDKWVHNSCSGLSAHIYEAMKSSSGIRICRTCGLPSFSSSLFDSFTSTDTSNSFSPLASCTVFNDTANLRPVDQVKPISASTPMKGPNSRKPDKVSMLSINVNSLRGKAIRLLELIHKEQPDIILCREAKLDAFVLSRELFPSEYTVCREDRNVNGGGVSIAIINKLKFIECNDLSNNSEALWINLQTSDHSPVNICFIYRPPDMKSEYIELLRQPLELLSVRHHNKLPLVIVAGDFNYPDIDWLTSSAPSDSAGGNFVDILNDFHLQQLVSQPTRFCKTTSSVLDLVACSYPALIEGLDVGDEFSDHCVISFKVSMATDMNISKPRKIFLYNRGDYDQLRSELHSFKNSFLASVPGSRSVN